MLPPRLPLAVLDGSAELGPMLFLGVHSAPAPALAPQESDGAPSVDNGQYFYVISISADGSKMFIWAVTCVINSATEKVSSKLVVQHSFPDDVKVSCASTSPSSPYTNADFTVSPSVVTGGVDGKVRVWCIARKGEKHKLREMISFEAYKNPVSKLECLQFGRIASTSTSTDKPEVHVWELQSSTPMFKLEATIPLTEEGALPGSPKVCYDWLALGNGNYILAVGCGTTIKIFGPTRSKLLQSFSVEWEVTDQFNALPQPCQSLVWARDGTLLVAAANNLYVFSKWREVFHANKETSSATTTEVTDSTDWITTFHRNSTHMSLPAYHPKILMEYLVAGHFARVGATLLHLLDCLEEHETSGKPGNAVFVPITALDELLSIEKGGFSAAGSQASRTGLSRTPSGNAGDDEEELLKPVYQVSSHNIEIMCLFG